MSTVSGENTLHMKCALVVKAAFDAVLIPAFEKSSGYKLDIDWAPTTVIMSKLADGATADLVLIVADSVDELIRQGKVEAETKQVVL